MKAKTKPRRHAKIKLNGRRVFQTTEEVFSHFLPKSRVQQHVPTGKEQGTDIAERTFAELSQSIRV